MNVSKHQLMSQNTHYLSGCSVTFKHPDQEEHDIANI